MCEGYDYDLPTSEDCAEWVEYVGVSYPVLADTEGTVCPSWEYPNNITTVFVLDVGGVVHTRRDTADPDAAELVASDVDILLGSDS